MDRNTALAFALSMLVFVLYLTYQQARYEETAREVERRGVAGEMAAEAGSTGSPADGVDGPVGRGDARPTPDAEPRPPAARRGAEGEPSESDAESTRTIVLETRRLENENVIAEISNGPALVESWRLKRYFERLPEGEIPIDLVTSGTSTLVTEIAGVPGASFADARFEIVSATDREIVQRARTSAGVLTRTLRLTESGYGFEIDLVFESRRQEPVDAELQLLWPVTVSERQDFLELSLIAYGREDGIHREAVAGIGLPGFFSRIRGGGASPVQVIEDRVDWAGFDIRYFTGVLIDPGERGAFDVRFEAVEPGQRAEARIALPRATIGSGGRIERSVRGYFGPKHPDELAKSGPSLGHTINRGWSWLEPLTRLFEIALDKLHRVIPNYGLAIIVLTILVRVVVSPLMVRQMKSAEKMRTAQPRLKAIQEKYKDDRQKQSEEMMKLWREEGINPLGGCLPLLLQFPVLIGLFYALQSSIGLRHAPFFGWIDDLSQPATLFTIPGLELPVRVLPIVMGASMYVQQKMTPTTGMDPAQARMMLIMMPGMMLLISYTFPSGLVLYWTVSNLLGIAHQYWIRSKMQPAAS